MTAAPRGRAARTATAIVTCCAAAVLLSSCSGDPAPTPSPTVEPAAADLEAAFRDALEAADVVGGTLAVRADGATTLYPVGTADVATSLPVGDDTVFGYRSATKSFVTTVVLQLVDEGRLALDDPVAGFLDGVPDGEQVTIGDLAAMRSGLVNYSASEAFAEAFMEDPTGPWTDDELLALALDEPLGFAPGTRFEYSNTNTILLGQVIEAETGNPWADEVSRRVLDPLGLDSVVYPGNDDLPPGTALPYEPGPDGPALLPVVRASAFSAAGGLFGTTADLARWAEALGSGELLEDTTQELRVDSLGPTQDDPNSPFYDAYGLGMGSISGWLGHTGNGLGFQVLALHDPATGTSVAITVNTTGDDPDLPAHVFLELLPLLTG